MLTHWWPALRSKFWLYLVGELLGAAIAAAFAAGHFGPGSANSEEGNGGREISAACFHVPLFTPLLCCHSLFTCNFVEQYSAMILCLPKIVHADPMGVQ